MKKVASGFLGIRQKPSHQRGGFFIDKESERRIVPAMTFSELVKQRRIERGLSVFDLAMRSGVMQATIHAVEAGKGCRLVTALRIAFALGFSSIPTDLQERSNAETLTA